MDRWKSMAVVFALVGLLTCMHAGGVTGEAVDLNAERVCIGTDQGFASPYGDSPGAKQNYYQDLKERYTNCTYVDGNLEITFLKDELFDLSFLSSIREVTGYVLILLTNAQVIPLTNLRVIRGTRLHENKYALYVALTFHTEDSNIATEEIRLTSLHEILNGDVFFNQNNQLCYVETIVWDDLQPGLVANITMWDKYPQKNCSHVKCHPSCNGHCWGPGPDHCQKLTLKNCSSTCDYRCRGPTQADCCHKSCAAGCTNSSNSGCLACRQFSLDNTCVEQCPRRYEYDRNTFTNVPNPNFRYSYGSRCLRNCPANVLFDGDNCVKVCGPGKREEGNQCIPCDGVCPSTCEGLGAREILSSTHIDSKRFQNCTKINGNLIITTHTFNGDPFKGTHEIHPRELEVFSTVKQITGFLSVQADHPEFTNLTMFRNLERIDGRELYGTYGALVILDNGFLESLNMVLLTEIAEGGAYVRNNAQLCYIAAGALEPIVNDEYSISIENNKDNVSCILDDQLCDPQCAKIGCWGPGPLQCAKCKNAIIGHQCIAACDVENGQYIQTEAVDSEPAICEYCDPECSAGCLGPGPENCSCMAGHEGPNCRRNCRNVQDGPYCRAECPELKYANQQRNCSYCHSNCIEGCNGPENTVGSNGCLKCAQVRLDSNGEVIECMPVNAKCGNDSYYDRISLSQTNNKLAGSAICRECHPMCNGCTGPGTRDCVQCRDFKQDEVCVESCRTGTYPDIDNVCQPCHEECRACVNATEYDCTSCDSITVDIGDGSFFCAPFCPTEYPYESRPYHCVAECPPMQFPNTDNTCEQCHTECKGGCHNGTKEGCFSCKNVMWNSACYRSCHVGYKTVNGTCVAVPLPPGHTGAPPPKNHISTGVLIAIGLGSSGLIVLILVGVFCYRKHYVKNMYIDIPPNIDLHDIKGSDYAGGPLTPSHITPNQAQLKIIKDTELKLGPVLGSGAFGTVYKGLWIPEGEKIRIPVAIKALREVSPNAAEELLEEAKVMASVDHPCLLRLLCVCIAQNMTLITQLMPLGALLDYVRQHKEQIGSHHLLNWSYQIAQGMVYLEEKHLIHRDLAARNVLVQSPAQVKITDFGLAKFLEVDESEYKAQGGKMPIKWLALECIQFRRFSHKSDVWSFGVTLWELMTFGGKPYEGVKAREVPELLERGERLPQPAICTIDIYMLMVKCWLIDEDSRPTFKQLSDELGRMTKDPQRYLVIQNDGILALPSPTPSDFYKTLIADADFGTDPDMLMDAEDYLQPMSLHAHNLTYESQQGFFPPNGSAPVSPSDKHSQPRTPLRKDSSLMRYCQDPTVKGNFDRQTNNMSGAANDDYLIPTDKLANFQPHLGQTAEEEHDYQNDPSQFPKEPADAYLPLNDGTGSQPTTPSPAAMVDNMEYHALMGNAQPQAKAPAVVTTDPWAPMQQHPHLMARQQSVPSQPRTPPAQQYTGRNASCSTPLLSDVSFEGPVPTSPPVFINGQNGHNAMYRSPPPSNTGSLGRKQPDHDYVNTDVVIDRGESTV